MLVAGASMSLIAPIAAQASDVVNLEEMNSYSRSETKSSRLDSETFINDFSESFFKIGLPPKDLLTSLTSKIGLSFLNFKILKPFFILDLH